VYLVQVERVPSEEALTHLRDGILIEGRRTKDASVRLLEDPPSLPPRSVPIRFRKNVPTAWIEIKLKEGKNRQVRKMTAAIGHPTLRLVRVSFGPLDLSGLLPGSCRNLTRTQLEALRSSLSIGSPPER
jgi:23S rRNA pseudouridine2457 synthase